jgi:hypothetical protein
MAWDRGTVLNRLTRLFKRLVMRLRSGFVIAGYHSIQASPVFPPPARLKAGVHG